MPALTTPAQRIVLRNLRAGRAACDGLAPNQRIHMNKILDGLRLRHWIDGENQITRRGENVIHRYDK
jgi:hypothetical protein